MARNLTEDGRYAREIGLSLTHGQRKIKNLGGASKLLSLSPEVRNLLLRPKKKDGEGAN